jgi:hypothetical protein
MVLTEPSGRVVKTVEWYFASPPRYTTRILVMSGSAMETLATVLRYELSILLLLLIAIIAYKLLVQQINVDGLLRDKTGGRVVSPGRLQMLVVTLSIALYYMFVVFEAEDKGTFPDMPNEFLLALGGSHAIYLSGKLYGFLATRFGFTPSVVEKLRKPK